MKNFFQTDWLSKWEDDRPVALNTVETSAANYLKKFSLVYLILRKIYRIINGHGIMSFFNYHFKFKKYQNYESLGQKMTMRDLIK